MRKILMFTCGVIMMSSVVLADDTTTTAETCANGAGTVVIGAVTGHKYCMSNNNMSWWNAYAWCDGLGTRLVDRRDCACSNITADCANNKCPEFKNTNYSGWLWSGAQNTSTAGYFIDITGGSFGNSSNSNPLKTLCY